MDTEQNKNLDNATEEQKAENEALKEVREDDLRNNLTEEFGLDPELDVEMIDKLVAREKESRSKLYNAIKQKRSWRERAENGTNKNSDKTEGNNSNGGPKNESLSKADIKKMFEERDLLELNLSDEIASKVKAIAEIKGISVREAAKDDYIVYLKSEYDKNSKVENGSVTRNNRGSASTKVDLSKPLEPEDFDFNTAEGREAWKKAKEARSKARREQNS